MCSLSGGVLLSLGDLTDNARIAGQCGLRLAEGVSVSRHKLPLVVRAKIQLSEISRKASVKDSSKFY